MRKTGTIKSLNVSPKGSYEGILLAVGQQTIQVNFPKQEPNGLGFKWVPGATLRLAVAPEEPYGAPEHKVFRLIQIIGTEDMHRRFSGRVERSNYALHGEVNGGILESGDFLHLKPEGAQVASLKGGMTLEGKGEMKPMFGGHFVIEAEEVNGHHLERKQKPKKNAHSNVAER